MKKKNYVIAITGASGSLYSRCLIEFLSKKDYNLYLIISETAIFIWKDELNETFRSFYHRIKKEAKANILLESNKDLTSICASGSFRHDGMIVAPCSMKVLSAAAHGISSNLMERAIDVCLKERFPLLLLLRETPFSLIHIRNMEKLSLAGAIIMPASPGFYHRDISLKGIINFVVGKILDNLSINHNLYKRWKS